MAVNVAKQLDPTSLVARIIAELQANPDAQRLLLRALLTNEFLGMPARLDRIEGDIAELKADVAVLKKDVAVLKDDVAVLKDDVAVLKKDVADLKGSDLENRLRRKIRALVSQRFELRELRVVQGPVQEPFADFVKQIGEALDGARITDAQHGRLEATDFILRGRRRADRTPVWIALEASNAVGASDIQRAGASAEALRTVFEEDVLAIAAGYSIDPRTAKRAEAAEVTYLEVSRP